METKTRSAPELKPGALLILPVLVSEFFFENFGFLSGTTDLDGCRDREHKQEKWLMYRDKKTRDHDLAEKINRIADF